VPTDGAGLGWAGQARSRKVPAMARETAVGGGIRRPERPLITVVEQRGIERTRYWQLARSQIRAEADAAPSGPARSRPAQA